MQVLYIGRDPACDVCLSDPSVSRRHARLVQDNSYYIIEDLGSANGTLVNGQRVAVCKVSPSDSVRLGDAVLPWPVVLSRFGGGQEGGLRLECLGVSVVTAGTPRRPLIREITFGAYGGQMIGLIGPSGAGKTVLLRTLVGQLPPTTGRVLCNGFDLALFPALVWTWIGYVPQDDIVHPELTVADALYYSARLRLRDKQELSETTRRVVRAAQLSGLSDQLHKPIRLLSGGQRKRASVAVELLTQPPIFVLDEPTSGLDPGLESEFMTLCRCLADQGHVVLFSTHVARSLHLCDRVLVLCGGRMVYYGPPSKLAAYFGVDEVEALYSKLTNPTVLETRFRESELFHRYVSRPLSSTRPTTQGSASWRRVGFWRQLAVLTSRYAAVLRGDVRNVALLSLQSPVIAVVLVAVFPSDTFKVGEHLGHSVALLCLLTMAALWFGTSNAAKEFVRERSVYTREVTLGLNSCAYLLSKLLLLLLIGFLQSLVLVGFVGADTEWFGGAGGRGVLTVFLLLGLTSTAGAALGLLVSAFARSPDQAVSLTPIVLLPQLVFCGVFVAVEEAGPVMKALSWLAFSNWCFGGLGATLGLNELYESSLTTAVLRRASFDRSVPASFAILGVLFAVTTAIAYLALTARRSDG